MIFKKGNRVANKTSFKPGNQAAVGHKCIPVNLIWTPEKIDKEAEVLIAWAKNEDSLVLGECYADRGYSYQEATDWAARNENFKRARFIAKTWIGARREKGGLKGKYDAGLVGKTMMLYDPEYMQHLREMKRDQVLEDCFSEQAAKQISNLLKGQSSVKNVG